MSLVPLLFSDWWEDLDYPHRLLDQNFGLGLTPEQLLSPSILEQYIVPNRERKLRQQPLLYYRPWGDLLRKSKGGGMSTVQADKDKFQVILDVQQFKPEEISVKIVDKYVVVEAKHEERQDEHGWISRQFIRKYLVPEQCDIDQVTSNLSSDGVLNISAPRKELLIKPNERTIKIQHTGKPAVQEATVKMVDVKETKKEVKREEKEAKKEEKELRKEEKEARKEEKKELRKEEKEARKEEKREEKKEEILEVKKEEK